jgi:hypothetical protein
VSITLSYQTLDGGGSFGGGSNYNASAGTFELNNVIPGSYVIQASIQDNIPAVVSADPVRTTRIASAANVPVDLFNGDLENVQLTLLSATPLSGRIASSGAPLPNPASVRVQLRPSSNGVVTNAVGLNLITIPTTNPDGSFRMDSVIPGEYRVAVQGLPPDFYVKDIQYNQNDALNKPLEYSGRDNGSLEVAVSSGAVQINGSATDDKSSPAPGVTIVLIPDQHRDRTDLYKNTTTDSTDRYSIRGVPPGDYKLFAWNSIAPFDWFDPAILGRDESRGKPVHVLESSNQTVDLKVIAEQ